MLVTSIIGNFGKYQFWVCFLIFLNKFGVSLHQMAIVFLAPPVFYTCPIANTSCCDNPIYNKTMFFRTIVMEWNLICGKSWLKDFSQTLFQFGVLLGSIIFGVASDRFGRKITLIVAVVLEVFAGIIVAFMPDYWSFSVIRMILGAAVGGVMVVGFVLIMEYTGLKYRELISTAFHIPYTMGHVILAIFGYYIRDYVIFQICISIVNIFLLIYICVLPESPRWLLATNKTFKAIKLLARIAKINNQQLINNEQEIQLVQFSSHNTQNKGSIIDMFYYPLMRRNILVMSFAWFTASYCYYGVFHYISHLTGNIFVNVASSGIVCLSGCIFIIPLLKCMFRKSLVITLNVLCSICLIPIIFVPESVGSTIVGCASVFFSYMSIIVLYLYCSEMFPTVVRNAAIGLSSMMARLGAMIAPFIVSLRPYGKWCAPVAFGVLPLITATLCVLLPETKGCDLLMTLKEGESLSLDQRRVSQARRSEETTPI